MKWKETILAVIAISMIALILVATPYLYGFLVSFPGLEVFAVLGAGMFLALAISIVTVVILGQVAEVEWNGWKLGGVFAGVVIVVGLMFGLRDQITAIFINKDLRPRLAQVAFLCMRQDQALAHTIDRVDGLQSIIVAIDGPQHETLLQYLDSIKTERLEYNEIDIVTDGDADYNRINELMIQHTGAPPLHPTWVAYEITTNRLSSFRTAAETLLPVPIENSGRFSAIFFLKSAVAAKSGIAGANDLSRATYSAAAAGTSEIKPFARMYLQPKEDVAAGTLTFAGRLQVQFLMEASEQEGQTTLGPCA